jgi:hypothetical protein
MSLKAVHLFFVVVLSALAFGLAFWKVSDFLSTGALTDLLFGLGAFISGCFVVWYGTRVYRKLKTVGYL